MHIMKTILKVLGKFKYVLFLMLILSCVSCSTTKKQKNTYYEKKRKEASKVNSTQLGRNRYYYSPGYKKKLEKSYKNVVNNRY